MLAQLVTVSNQLVSIFDDTKYFGFQEFPEDQMAEFIWFPPLLEYTNKTYIVEVTATARSTENNKILKENTQFTLNVSYVTDYDFAQLSMLADTAELGLGSQGESDEQTRFMNSRQLYSDFSIVPQTREIETFAMDRWENIITVYNLNLLQDLRVNPKIEVTDPKPGIENTLQYDIIDENKLKIKGKAPEYGSSKVRLTLQRDYDGRLVTEEFKVSVLLRGEPEFQSTMYPEINYTIKPNLPLSSNLTTTALIKTQNDDTLAISKGGNDFIYKPQHRDTASQLFFVRYIDGKLTGQKYTLNVLSYPAPEISSLNEVTNTKVEIYTASKGIINGRENYVTELKIEGNAKYRELTGYQKIDRNLNIRQKFEIIALDPSKPFKFTVKAKNIQGKISEETKWPKYK